MKSPSDSQSKHEMNRWRRPLDRVRPLAIIMPGISIVPAPEFPSPPPRPSSMRVILIPFSCIISPSMLMVSNQPCIPLLSMWNNTYAFSSNRSAVRPSYRVDQLPDRERRRSITDAEIPRDSRALRLHSAALHAFFPQQKIYPGKK